MVAIPRSVCPSLMPATLQPRTDSPCEPLSASHDSRGAADVGMAVMFAVTQGTSAAAPGGHKAVMINGSMRPSVGEDLAQGGGEGVRLARLAVFAEDSVVAAGEGWALSRAVRPRPRC